MADTDSQPKVDAEAIASKLDLSLKSCRAMISGYRSLLGTSATVDQVMPDNDADADAETDLREEE